MYRFQQFLILVAHLVLLWWIMFVLQNSGQFTVEKTIAHFFGLSLMGAGLIYGTAQWAKYHHFNNSDH